MRLPLENETQRQVSTVGYFWEVRSGEQGSECYYFLFLLCTWCSCEENIYTKESALISRSVPTDPERLTLSKYF